jgi:hypothetical protein
MRSLLEQKKELQQTGPAQGIPETVMERVLSLLSDVAQELDHLEYYVLQWPGGGWFLLSPSLERWIPAFPDHTEALKMVTILQQTLPQASELKILNLGVLELLFLGLGLTQAKGILFYDQEGAGKGITQTSLKSGLKHYLKDLPPPPTAIV